MRLKHILLAFLLCAATLVAQTSSPIPIQGHLVDAKGAGFTNIGVKFQLYNCGANTPRIPGQATVVQQTFTVRPDASGSLASSSNNVWPNDIITCAGTPDTTRYWVQYVINNVPQQPQTCYYITAAMLTFNLDTAVPCSSVTPPPPPPGPTDATYRNMTLTGLLTGTNAIFSGRVTAHEFYSDQVPGQCATGYFMTGLQQLINVTPNCRPLGNVVTTFNGRTGSVSPQAADYDCTMVTNCPTSLYYQTIFNGVTQMARRAQLRFTTADFVATDDGSGAGTTQIALANVTTPATCAYPAALTYDAKGRVIGCVASSGFAGRTCNANGCYQQYPDGTIVASGQSAVVGSNTSATTLAITFPFAFTSTTNLHITVSPVTDAAGDGNPHPADCHIVRSSLSTTGATSVIAISTQVSGSGYDHIVPGDYCAWEAIGK